LAITGTTTAPGPVERQVVSWYRIGDVLTHDDKAAKIATLQAKLFGGPQRAVAVHVSAEVQPGVDTRAVLTRFVAALGPIERVADRAAGMND
jgi:EpsI family protein